jgi:hypothetical protein
MANTALLGLNVIEAPLDWLPFSEVGVHSEARPFGLWRSSISSGLSRSRCSPCWSWRRASMRACSTLLRISGRRAGSASGTSSTRRCGPAIIAAGLFGFLLSFNAALNLSAPAGDDAAAPYLSSGLLPHLERPLIYALSSGSCRSGWQ